MTWNYCCNMYASTACEVKVEVWDNDGGWSVDEKMGEVIEPLDAMSRRMSERMNERTNERTSE